MTLSRITAYAFLVATLAVHTAVAWLSPVQGDDWNQLLWARAHADEATGTFLWNFLREHTTYSEIVSYAVASSTVFHMIATPLAVLALVFGIFVVAARRMPSFDQTTDVVVLIVLSALLWLGAPRAGVTFFHRAYAAQWIFGLAATVWILVPFRCGWRAPRGAVLIALVGGFCAGSSARQLGFLALILVVIAMFRGPRARWMWGALVGLVVGQVLVFLDRPQIDFRGFKPGFDATLKSLGIPFMEGGELISLVMALVLVKLVLARLRPTWVPESSSPDTSDTVPCLLLWLLMSVLAMFGPRYNEALHFPGAVILAIAAYPYIAWLATAPPMRLLLVAIAVGTHLIAWTLSLSTYVRVNADYRDRIARLERGQGSVDIPPYTRVKPSFWFFGEDFGTVRQRQLVAIGVFGLDDITISPPFRGYERSVKLAVHLVADGVPEAQLVRVQRWATTPSVARKQLEGLVASLDARARSSLSAKLVVQDLTFAEARGREILLAAYERGVWTLPTATRRGPRDDNRMTIRVRPQSFVTSHPEAYAIVGQRATQLTLERGEYRIHPDTTDLHGLVSCSPTRCILVEAFIPRL